MMKTAMKSCIALFGTSVALAHHHGGHHNKQHQTQTSTQVPPVPSTSTSASTEPPTSSTTPADTTPFVVPPVSPVMKQMLEKAEMQQIEEATDVFYRMFYGGHIQSFDNIEVNTSDQSPVKDVKACQNCNEERRYQDFDYQFLQDNGATKTCYEIRRSDEGYGKYEFEDISLTGIRITSDLSSGVAQVTLSTSFPFFDRTLEDPVTNIFVDGYISFSETSVSSGANTMPNPSEGPFDLIAPFFQDQTLTGPGALVSPQVYYKSDDTETIIQWETNEGVKAGQYSKSTQGGSVYQMKIESSGKISFAYKLATCEIPSWSTVQVGVKPLENELASGYRTSFFQSACQDGGYFAPCPGMSIVLKRVKCSSLIGQTGIKKPKAPKKKSYSKDSVKLSSDYSSKKQRYMDYFNKRSSKMFRMY